MIGEDEVYVIKINPVSNDSNLCSISNNRYKFNTKPIYKITYLVCQKMSK